MCWLCCADCAVCWQREAASAADDDIHLDIPTLLSQQHHLDLDVSFNISQLLDDDHKVSHGPPPTPPGDSESSTVSPDTRPQGSPTAPDL